MRLLAPSILAADFLHLEKDIRLINGHADIIHLDVMDGTLVPNISFGFSVIDAVAEIAEKPMDAHLMIVHPEKYFARCAKAGCSMLSFHLEAARKARRSPARLLDEVRSLGMTPGLAINPDIPVEDVFPYLDHAGYILVMSVFAGFGGQKFMADMLPKVSNLRDCAENFGLHNDRLFRKFVPYNEKVSRIERDRLPRLLRSLAMTR